MSVHIIIRTCMHTSYCVQAEQSIHTHYSAMTGHVKLYKCSMSCHRLPTEIQCIMSVHNLVTILVSQDH